LVQAPQINCNPVKLIYGSRHNDCFIFFQVLDPSKRLGASDAVGYPSLRSHPFFAGIDFETLHEQTPPKIYPYLPGTSEHEEMRSRYRVSCDNRFWFSCFTHYIVKYLLLENPGI
jgi:hypothetical protein